MNQWMNEDEDLKLLPICGKGHAIYDIVLNRN